MRMIPLFLAASFTAILTWPIAALADGPIRPTREGVIRVCWGLDILAGKNCHKYHHIKLPPSIAIGDTFRVEYGSNPKGFQFRVRRIAVESGVCSIYSGQTSHLRDRIKVGCDAAP
ncbi:MAG: hypothetical protein JO001_30040 [Alphaproteobacteria bacterium]|nr:hypothetical protein [Alphaproteobacteria bacterium]